MDRSSRHKRRAFAAFSRASKDATHRRTFVTIRVMPKKTLVHRFVIVIVIVIVIIIVIALDHEMLEVYRAESAEATQVCQG